MSLAYLIITHKTPEQLGMLLDALQHPDDLFIIHISKKTEPGLARQLRLACGDAPNVRFLEPRPIVWGGWDLAAVELDAMALALKEGAHWTHYINLSGQDFPLKPVSEIKSTLVASDPNTNYMGYRPLSSKAFSFRVRCWFAHSERDGRLQRDWALNPTPRILGKLYHGLKWGIFSRAFCEWLCEDGPQVQAAKAYFSRTKIPDEMLMQTLILNSPFAETVDRDHKREVEFDDGSPNPIIYTSSDLDRLKASPAFFARKFDIEVDADVLNALAEHVRPSPSEIAQPAPKIALDRLR